MAEQLITPLEKLETLSPFEGQTVLGVGIEIPGAGGGLRDALTIDPQQFHKGDRVFVVIEGKVGKIRFDPVKDTDGVKRVHVLEVQGATIAERETVESLLAEQAKRIEEAMGLKRIEFDDELFAAHTKGEHAGGLVEGCVECEKEAELEAQENDGDGDGDGEGDDS